MLQVTLAALALYFLMRLAVILFDELSALIAGLAFALYPPLIWVRGRSRHRELVLVSSHDGLVRVLCASRRPLHDPSILVGILVGLTSLCRPNGLMLGPALVLAIWLTTSDWKQASRRIILLTFAVALMVLPWTYRNYRLFHKAVLISTNGGGTLWAGAHLRLEPGATLAEVGYSQHAAFRDISETDREQYYYQQAFLILDHSPRFGENCSSRISQSCIH